MWGCHPEFIEGWVYCLWLRLRSATIEFSDTELPPEAESKGSLGEPKCRFFLEFDSAHSPEKSFGHYLANAKPLHPRFNRGRFGFPYVFCK